jgi:hypothetical protein
VNTVLSTNEYGDITAINFVMKDSLYRNTLVTVEASAPAHNEVQQFSARFLGRYRWNMRGCMIMQCLLAYYSLCFC